MDERGYKDNLKKIILALAEEEVNKNGYQKNIIKYLEGNIDKVIDKKIKTYDELQLKNIKYIKILKRASKEENIVSIAKIIKSELGSRNKIELIELGEYLGIRTSKKYQYNQILRKISSHIYMNRDSYKSNHILYRKDNKEYYLDPEQLKTDLIESYKSKTRKDMNSIAKILNIEIEENYSAEDIRRQIINYIIKEKISKNKDA